MSDPHEYWSELTATALVGAGRRPALPRAPAPLDRLAAGDGADAAAALLDAAAAATLFVRAGALPAATPAAPVAPCPADERPPCGPRAARHLAAMLAPRHRPVLSEWLAALAAAGRRPPDALLPALLDLGRGDEELGWLVLAAAGERGRWLAGLNPDWAALAEGSDLPGDEAALTARWQGGARAVRARLLRALRRERPALARALLAATWADERADDRAAFLGLLRDGLGADDEPFLEAALDDRSKEVRATAADLLAHLPESRLARLMTERALGLVRLRPGLLPKIEVALPEACDRELQRYGVDPKPEHSMGERAWWLFQIVRRTPPGAWCAAWSLTPGAVIGLRAPKEWRELFVHAWAAAAIAYGDGPWIAALAEHAADDPQRRPLHELALALPRERRERLLVRLLGEAPLGQSHAALAILRAAPGPWGAELARAVVVALARALTPSLGAMNVEPLLRDALPAFALAIPPDMAEQAIGALPQQLLEPGRWGEAGVIFAERLRLRREMYEALGEA
jgi:hypothetical protein